MRIYEWEWLDNGSASGEREFHIQKALFGMVGTWIVLMH